MKTILLTIAIALIISVATVVTNDYFVSPRARVAYVDSNKLMVSFNEAVIVKKKLEEEKNEFDTNLQALQDSLKVHMDVMSKTFDTASADEKNELRQKLQKLNDDMGRYERFGKEEMMKRHQERMRLVLEKVDSYVSEYAEIEKYELVLGSTNSGNILYGNEGRFNITLELIKGLNERYK